MRLLRDEHLQYLRRIAAAEATQSAAQMQSAVHAQLGARGDEPRRLARCVAVENILTSSTKAAGDARSTLREMSARATRRVRRARETLQQGPPRPRLRDSLSVLTLGATCVCNAIDRIVRPFVDEQVRAIQRHGLLLSAISCHRMPLHCHRAQLVAIKCAARSCPAPSVAIRCRGFASFECRCSCAPVVNEQVLYRAATIGVNASVVATNQLSYSNEYLAFLVARCVLWLLMLVGAATRPLPPSPCRATSPPPLATNSPPLATTSPPLSTPPLSSTLIFASCSLALSLSRSLTFSLCRARSSQLSAAWVFYNQNDFVVLRRLVRSAPAIVWCLKLAVYLAANVFISRVKAQFGSLIEWLRFFLEPCTCV